MKKTAILLMLVALAGCASRYVLKPAKFDISGVGGMVAVMPFSDLRDIKSQKKFASPSKIIQERLISGLSNRGLSVVDRENLDKILAEQKLSASGLVNADEAVEIGKLAGAKVVIFGSVTEYGRTIYPKVKLSLTIKAVDVEKGVVVKSLDVSAKKINWFYPIELPEDVVSEAMDKILKAVR